MNIKKLRVKYRGTFPQIITIRWNASS